ncbi:MAG: hypothetical protein M1829_003417 [Trizodia sp. TS-e1964]|nr:MAG: hypothetical protein M1829_003417 [Trizodia sp. TS-e1964]
MSTFSFSNWIPRDPYIQIYGIAIVLALLIIIVFLASAPKADTDQSSGLVAYLTFFYVSFLKPHTGDLSNSQQDALESFYRAQASVYDATRKSLLRGREDLLGLLAAQLKYRAASSHGAKPRRVWVDIGGGTGYNIEAMGDFVSVPDFFTAVYLVDFSPSLCDVARKRFERLGWKNVKVVCQDARAFRLEDHEPVALDSKVIPSSPPSYFSTQRTCQGADMITMSYSLSMIPDFYSVIDSLCSLLSPFGIIGVTDFYVQSIVDLTGRNYTGGVFNRHVNWLGRVFWRAWFEMDRVGLEAGRRDYLEYRFGTMMSFDTRNYRMGGIPYYIWVGCPKQPSSLLEPSTNYSQEVIERLDAAATESPYLSPTEHRNALIRDAETLNPPEIRSKAFDAAVVNLATNLPLPSFFYQNHHWRIYYDDHLKKHKQFNNEYIYAFTWEDARVDQRLLRIGEHDVVLAITSAGDNILAYAMEGPKRIHAVDLNPTQNHLLELKVAAFTALSYADMWKVFGEGKHPSFRELLISKLSPHLSSRALQYWLENSSVFTSRGSNGLYETGGSRYAIKLSKWLFRLLGLSSDVRRLCAATTLNEQREIWHKRIRGALLNRLLSWAVVSNEQFLWKAFGVPAAQRNMITKDFLDQESVPGTTARSDIGGRAIWEYVVNTLDPVIENTLIGEDNYFYLLCVQGSYSRKCHPAYLTPKAHVKLSRPGAFDGLRIHTDEINEVISRMTPNTLTIAVVMDSMDWMTPGGAEASRQISALNRALKLGGRVLLRSAGLSPWYCKEFEELGFTARRVSARVAGSCIDRVNIPVLRGARTPSHVRSQSDFLLDASGDAPLLVALGMSLRDEDKTPTPGDGRRVLQQGHWQNSPQIPPRHRVSFNARLRAKSI